MNIVLIIIDTLRQDHIGAYGNEWIHTPNLDQFASESVTFTRAYPESLPTLPFRRAIHSGKRTFPFHGHRDYKGDFIGAPGWGPKPDEQKTVAEILSAHGYKTALITDTYHQFKPSKNFHRGFQEWIWIRGQENDPFRTGPHIPWEQIEAHIPETMKDNPRIEALLEQYLKNVSQRRTEADYFSAQVFSEASRWFWENQMEEQFFLVVDSFDPHEPWDPPAYYRRLYDPDDSDVMEVLHSGYQKWEGLLTPRELKRVQSNYAGEVTMVDRWLGHFLKTLQISGCLNDTVVAIISDHGHNLGIDPGDKGLVSKQGHPMTHAVADLVMMIRHPNKVGAGIVCDALCYNLDLTTTLMKMVGADSNYDTDGIDLSPIVTLNTQGRDHVTIAWGPLITVITDNWWYNASIWGESPLLYQVKDDANIEHNLAHEYSDVCERLRNLAVDDAGGEIPEAFKKYLSIPGCTPLLE